VQIQGFNRLPTIGGKDVDITFDYSDELIFVHLPEVRRMSREAISELAFLIEEWSPFLKMSGYPAVFGLIPDEKKTVLKLVDRLGFVVHGYKDNHTIVRLDLGE